MSQPGVQGVIARPLTALRGPLSVGLAESDQLRVEREGGDQQAGLIRGFAVCTVGEALGHRMWCDGVMLQQIVDLGNEKLNGVKARFTHPGLSSDGLGSFLGRAKNLFVDGEVVRGDLHFDKTAHDTPDGNLAKYAMDLAESDPEAFGSSIVFTPDYKAEKEFSLANQSVDDEGYSSFKSPDPRNSKNYFHARLSELRAVDVVDEPAANPDGLFHIASDTLSQAQAFMAFALGLSEELPQGELAAQVNPERARGFVARFLAEKGLMIGPVESAMTKTPDAQPEALSADEALQKARQEVQAECQRYTAKFGSRGAEWFSQGLTWEQACDKQCELLTAERDAAVSAKAEAESQLAALDRGEKTPVDSPDKKTSYAEAIKRRA